MHLYKRMFFIKLPIIFIKELYGKLEEKNVEVDRKKHWFFMVECNKSNDKHVKALVDKINHNHINIM